MDWFLFIPTFFFVSITPGICMTFSMTLGMTVGIRRTYAMMIGELFGVALVSLFAVIGVAAILVKHPVIFQLFKYLGGGYLAYLGILLWLSRGKMAISQDLSQNYHHKMSNKELMIQGFVTAVANPKGWAFMVSLLPPFINYDAPLAKQFFILIGLILIIEWLCLNIYAMGGKTLYIAMNKGGYVKLLNRIAGSLMILVGFWLALG